MIGLRVAKKITLHRWRHRHLHMLKRSAVVARDKVNSGVIFDAKNRINCLLYSRFLPDPPQEPQDIPPKLRQGRSRFARSGGVSESRGRRSLQGRSLRKRGNLVNLPSQHAGFNKMLNFLESFVRNCIWKHVVATNPDLQRGTIHPEEGVQRICKHYHHHKII